MKSADAYTLSAADLTKAGGELRRMLLRRGLSRRWVNDNAEELLSRAATEYAAKLAEGVQVRSPVGWIINCAWWRAKDLLTQEGRQVEMRTLEAADQLADERAQSPEERALDRDSDERLRELLAELPEGEQRLLSLIYFDDHSVREAGAKVGMPRTTANRRHNAALAKLRARLAHERSPASLAGIGLIAWRGLAALRHRAADFWRRASGLADPTGPLASGGGGRALGACGVAAATLICGAAGILPALPDGAPPPQPAHHLAAQAKERAPDRAPGTPLPVDTPSASAPVSAPTHPVSKPDAKPARSTAKSQRSTTPSAPQSSGEQTTSEFGVERENDSAAVGTESAAPSSASRVSSAATVSPAPARPTSESAARTSGDSSNSEFGL